MPLIKDFKETTDLQENHITLLNDSGEWKVQRLKGEYAKYKKIIVMAVGTHMCAWCCDNSIVSSKLVYCKFCDQKLSCAMHANQGSTV